MHKKKVRTGKKVKTKVKPKPKVNKFEKIVDELDKRVPFRICDICEREGRDLRMYRLGRYRCADCGPGTPNWLDWYERHPKEHTEAGDRIYNYGRKQS